MDETYPQLISIKSLENPDLYIRVVNGFSVVLEKINLTNRNHTRDATFIVRQGLADKNMLSFEVFSKKNFFLRELDG